MTEKKQVTKHCIHLSLLVRFTLNIDFGNQAVLTHVYGGPGGTFITYDITYYLLVLLILLLICYYF